MKIGLCLRDLAYVASRVIGPAYDTMQSYLAGASMDGLNGGTDWAGPYKAGASYFNFAANDTMQSYATSDPLDGLNDGTNWAGSYIDRT